MRKQLAVLQKAWPVLAWSDEERVRMQATLPGKPVQGFRVLRKMKAKEWFDRALDAQSKALSARGVVERRQHAHDAFHAFVAAASLDHPAAALSIATAYQKGLYGVVPANAGLAEHWLRLAAARDPGGMLALGTFLMEKGRKAEARRWLRKALAHGEGGAACHLGREREARSPAGALRWYLKGVALDDPFAAVCAGEVLEARGSRRSLLRAQALYEKAVRQQFPGARKDVARTRRLLRRLG